MTSQATVSADARTPASTGVSGQAGTRRRGRRWRTAATGPSQAGAPQGHERAEEPGAGRARRAPARSRTSETASACLTGACLVERPVEPPPPGGEAGSDSAGRRTGRQRAGRSQGSSPASSRTGRTGTASQGPGTGGGSGTGRRDRASAKAADPGIGDGTGGGTGGGPYRPGSGITAPSILQRGQARLHRRGPPARPLGRRGARDRRPERRPRRHRARRAGSRRRTRSARDRRGPAVAVLARPPVRHSGRRARRGRGRVQAAVEHVRKEGLRGMESVLIVITLVSLALTIALAAVLARLMRDERRRSDGASRRPAGDGRRRARAEQAAIWSRAVATELDLPLARRRPDRRAISSFDREPRFGLAASRRRRRHASRRSSRWLRWRSGRRSRSAESRTADQHATGGGADSRASSSCCRSSRRRGPTRSRSSGSCRTP